MPDGIYERLQGTLEVLSKILASVGFIFLVFISFLTMFDAVMRWAVLPSIPGFLDWGRIMFPIIICAVFPAVLINRRNVSIKFLGTFLGVKPHAWLECFAAILTFIFFICLAWQFILTGIDVTINNRVTGTVKILVAPWWWIATTFIIFCVPVQLWMLVKSFFALRTGGEKI
jgi:TRAP-type C4-dicarboxylate transport system permease small subunit|tara:strand:- start:234 stop:749 length:516 start_codon:yes stop_codon:yes gene_type:complete